MFFFKGEEESPVFAFPLLLRKDPHIENLFLHSFSWKFECLQCGYHINNRLVSFKFCTSFLLGITMHFNQYFANNTLYRQERAVVSMWFAYWASWVTALKQHSPLLLYLREVEFLFVPFRIYPNCCYCMHWDINIIFKNVLVYVFSQHKIESQLQVVTSSWTSLQC